MDCFVASLLAMTDYSALRALFDRALDRGQFGLVPNSDQDAILDLQLVLRIGGDLLVAGGGPAVQQPADVGKTRTVRSRTRKKA